MFLFEGYQVGVGGINENSSMNELSNWILDIFEQLHFVLMFLFFNFIWMLMTLRLYVYINNFDHFMTLLWLYVKKTLFFENVLILY